MSLESHPMFSPGELSDQRGPAASTADLAEAVEVGRELERLATVPDVRPSDGFVSAVLLAIASEPLPAPVVALGHAVRAKRAGGVLRALADSWRVVWSGGRPLSVRLQGVAFVLVVAMLIAALGGTALVGAAAWLSQPSPPLRPHVTEPALAPAPGPTATPSATRKLRLTETPARSPSPSPERSLSPRSTAPPNPTATPNETDDPDGTSTPEPTETPDDSPGDDVGGG